MTVSNLKSLQESQEQLDRMRQRLAEAVAEADTLISEAESRLCAAPLLEGFVKTDATFDVPGVGEPLRLALEVRRDRYGEDPQLRAEIVIAPTVQDIFRDPALKRQRPVVRVAAVKAIPGLVQVVTLAYEEELALIESVLEGA